MREEQFRQLEYENQVRSLIQRNIENDIKQLKRDLHMREEQFRQLEYENQVRSLIWS